MSGTWTSTNRSPPTPHVSGATTPCTAFAAIAPSTALPPEPMISIAAWVDSSCGVTAAAFSPLAVRGGIRCMREP